MQLTQSAFRGHTVVMRQSQPAKTTICYPSETWLSSYHAISRRMSQAHGITHMHAYLFV